VRPSHAHPADHDADRSPRSDVPTHLPLSFQQQWLLELARRHPQWNCASGYTFRLQGVLAVDLLRRSLEEVVRRHGSLRARIISIDGRRWQSIDDARPYDLETVPIHGTSRAQIEANASRIAGELYDLRLDPSGGPLWVAKVLRLSDREHWLVLVMHRLIAECSSIERVVQEIRSVYDDLTGVRPATLQTPPPQYADYAVWQHETCADWEKKHAAHWNDHLAGAAGVRWPDDPNVTAGTGYSPGKMSCSFGGELSMSLRELSRKLRVLTPTIMLAVYAATLWRWTRQNDFILPFNVAGRQSQQRPVVGYFSYILYLRAKLTGEETFQDLLNHISNEFYRALAHQDFGRMCAQRPELFAGTLFQWITWHPDDATQAPAQTAAHPLDIAVDRVPIRNFGEGLTIVPPAMSDIEITLFDTADGLSALGTYSANRFTAQLMDQLIVDLRSATQRFVHDPDARVAW
jgi:Condensation domain